MEEVQEGVIYNTLLDPNEGDLSNDMHAVAIVFVGSTPTLLHS